MIEQSVGIICACLPTLRPLFGRILGAVTHQSNTSYDTFGGKSTSPSVKLTRLRFRDRETDHRDDSLTGFARFGGEEDIGNESAVTTHVLGAANGRSLVVPEGAVVRDRSIEQRIDGPQTRR